VHGMKSAAERRAKVIEALERVGLSPVELFLTKYPRDLSGGQKQRVVLARAIIMDPNVLVADEPISMLDMSVRAKILQLMLDLKDQLGLSYVYITHDLASAKYFCDRIAIMYLGRIVEIGPSAGIYEDPKHPYTQALLRAIPEPDPLREVARDLPRGEVPDAAQPPLGCSFHPRCPKAFEVCGWEARDLADLLERRWAHMGAEDYERERAIVGPLAELEEKAIAVRVPARKGATGADLLGFLESLREEDPEEPFWRGVKSLTAEADHVEVVWWEPIDPRLLPSGEVRVECHLYDEEALAEAERRRAAPEGVR
jgi:oligopeptide/dipeptide ABC transporter ATP-binding protein